MDEGNQMVTQFLGWTFRHPDPFVRYARAMMVALLIVSALVTASMFTAALTPPPSGQEM